MKKLLFTVLLSVSLLATGAKEKDSNRPSVSEPTTWEFYNIYDDLPQSVANNPESKINYLKKMVNEKFVVKEEVVPGDPSRRTTIRRPGIYSAVNNIEKHIKRELKDHKIDQATANNQMEIVLSVALAAVSSSDSESFEDILSQNRKDASKQIELFKKVKLI